MSVAAASTRASRPEPARKTRWTAADIPDLRGRVAVVTGANSGVGYEIAKAMGLRGAHVVLAARDRSRTEEAAARIRAEAPSASVQANPLDLGSFASIRRFAEVFSSRHGALDVLINNAGVSGGPRRVTEDGLETHLQVNYLGHFALTGLLLPSLRARPGARVVSISSDIAARASIDFDDLQASRRYGLVKTYAQSKLANLIFAFELDRRSRAAGAGIASFAAHPGVAKSNLLVQKQGDWGRSRNVAETLLHLVQTLLAQPAAIGALPALYQATSPEANSAEYVGPAGSLHGRGFPGACPVPPNALDRDVATRLWDVSTELTGVAYDALSLP